MFIRFSGSGPVVGNKIADEPFETGKGTAPSFETPPVALASLAALDFPPALIRLALLMGLK